MDIFDKTKDPGGMAKFRTTPFETFPEFFIFSRNSHDIKWLRQSVEFSDDRFHRAKAEAAAHDQQQGQTGLEVEGAVDGILVGNREKLVGDRDAMDADPVRCHPLRDERAAGGVVGGDVHVHLVVCPIPVRHEIGKDAHERRPAISGALFPRGQHATGERLSADDYVRIKCPEDFFEFFGVTAIEEVPNFCSPLLKLRVVVHPLPDFRRGFKGREIGLQGDFR